MSKITHNNVHTENNAVSSSKHYSAQLSHYFLNNNMESLPIWRNTTIIPVLLDSKNNDYVVHELNHAFNCQNSTSMVLKVESHQATTNHLPVLANDVIPTLMTYQEDEKISLPDFCLVPALSPSAPLVLQSDYLLIAVQASLSGVRIAYNQLAFIASLNIDLTVYIIMLSAKTKPQANRFYKFLCGNVQSLLSLKLKCGGYLLQSRKHAGDEKNIGKENEEIATDLNGIAANLLRQFTAYNKSTHSTVSNHSNTPQG